MSLFTMTRSQDGLALCLAEELEVSVLMPGLLEYSSLRNFVKFLTPCCRKLVATVWSEPSEGGLRPLGAQCSSCGLSDDRAVEGVAAALIFQRADFDLPWLVRDFTALDEITDTQWNVLASEIYLADLRNAILAALSGLSTVLDGLDPGDQISEANYNAILEASLENSGGSWG